MNSLGIDLGASTVKVVLLRDHTDPLYWLGIHQGRPFACLAEGLRSLGLDDADPVSVCVTGSNAEALLEAMPDLARLSDIPAIVEGVQQLVPEAGSIIEIGSQGARFITCLKDAAPQFAVNEHCAGGTGSFFEDQMNRLGCRLTDYSMLVEQAHSVPRLSGRCAVFAKTDIIHRQQEGVTTPDILLGLCYAMIRNYKATIVKSLPVERPVVFCGGVTCNSGVVRAIKEVFGLTDEELVVPGQARYDAALGAAFAARSHSSRFTIGQLLAVLSGSLGTRRASHLLPPLVLATGTQITDPAATHEIPEGGCALGIDIGSTSTDLVLVGGDGTLVDFQYLRTAGDPEAAVRKGLSVIKKRYGNITFTAVGVTGSGRERIGKMIGADAVRDEITAQARGASFHVPAVDTVFEIGGQDSKYISIRNGEVVDFQMNKICAAGTGSFVEEQAARMGIPIAEFGPLALTAENPAALGERCTVFIETAITSAAAEGVSQAEIAAGLCHAIVRNYLHKVVGSKPVGQHIVLQGGVDYNPGIVAAFQSAYGDRVTVSPCFAISGAFGAALLAQEAVGDAPSSFVGFDNPNAPALNDARSEEIRRNIAFYKQADQLLLDGYTGEIDPRKKTVGVPFVLMIHKFFPMANAYFRSLGFNVLLTRPTDEETIRLSQLAAQGETCYPVKLIYGHMQQLIDAHVDYIFLPRIHTMRHETSGVEHNYGCVYMQTAAVSIAKALDIESKGITLLSPEFDLDFGQQAMGKAMVGLSKILGIPQPFCAKALMSGAMAVRKHGAAVERQGQALLATLQPEDKVLVLITRNYGVSDPILNMGIPELLLERGYKVITLSHLPGHNLDISPEYDNLYWPFGQHILSGAKLIANHPNLYAVYLTNHGCGPDTMLSHLFRKEMGDKPYLQIEVDEHFSKVGVITRIEAFLNSLRHRPAVSVPAEFDIENVAIPEARLPRVAQAQTPLYVPALGHYTPFLVSYLRAQGLDAHALPALDEHALGLGRAETAAKEYLPFPALLGSILANYEVRTAAGDASALAAHGSAGADGCNAIGSASADGYNAIGSASADGCNAIGSASADGCCEPALIADRALAPAPAQYLIPQTLGSEADGAYARVIRTILNRHGLQSQTIVGPILETLPATAADRELLFRALLAGDLLYAAPVVERDTLAAVWTSRATTRGTTSICDAQSEATRSTTGAPVVPAETSLHIPTWDDLMAAAQRIAAIPVQGRRLAAVGTPLCLTELDDHVLETLEREGDTILRAPLSEALWFLWQDNDKDDASAAWLADMRARMAHLGTVLGARSAFSADAGSLAETADKALLHYAGGNGRYRYAKAASLSRSVSAVLTLAPRYENTAMILEMRGLREACKAPLFQLSLDHDWDEAAWSRLRSFLYYCR